MAPTSLAIASGSGPATKSTPKSRRLERRSDMPALIVAGAHILCYVNGRLYAQVSEFKWSSSTPRKAIHGIDATDPFELAPTITMIKGEVKVFRLSGDGGFQGLGVSASFSDLPKEKYFG